ncbi:MAG: hypothetical protein MMC33_001423 [Icmadophila ericetorum]|nr:hypothetical protein [Icmadophila ericetorum]
MDSLELFNIQTAFYQGQYQTVIDFDTSSFSAENVLPARILQLRAQIASGQAEEVLADVEGEDEVPDLAAVKAFAQYIAGDVDNAVNAVMQLSSANSENGTVQVLGGTVLQATGKSDEALELLMKHQGNLEAVALIVQIHLSQNRMDLAVKEVQTARKWAQDSLLIRIADAWVGLRIGGEKYQSAFYEFEEMAQGPSTSATKSLISQAVAEMHLGRLPEAEAALEQARTKDPNDTEAIANSIVLNVLSGKDASELLSSLQAQAPEHLHLVDLRAKSDMFDQAALKYTAKASS